VVNVDETRALLRLIASVSPGQKINASDVAALTEMATVWQGIIADVRYADAVTAVKALASRQPFIAPAEILQEVRKIRRERLARAALVLPNVDPDDTAAWIAEERAILAAIADGVFDAEVYAAQPITLTGRPAHKAIAAEVEHPEILDRVRRFHFRRVPKESA
jgi:hypothetical protein